MGKPLSNTSSGELRGEIERERERGREREFNSTALAVRCLICLYCFVRGI